MSKYGSHRWSYPISLTVSLTVAAVPLELRSALSMPAANQPTHTSAQLQSKDLRLNVHPDSWEYRTLKAISDHYNCIPRWFTSNPPNRTLTRYEFAAALHACMDDIGTLSASSTTKVIKEEDSETLQTLQGRFSNEFGSLNDLKAEMERRDPEYQRLNATKSQVTAIWSIAPADWTYQALRSLIDRYGCLQGVALQENQPVLREQFAVSLSTCLNRTQELLEIERLAVGPTKLVEKEDLATLQKLQQKFAAEIAAFRNYVQRIEATVGPKVLSTPSQIRFGIIHLYPPAPDI